MDEDTLDSMNASDFWLEETALVMQSAFHWRAWILEYSLATWCPAMAFSGRFLPAAMALAHMRRVPGKREARACHSHPPNKHPIHHACGPSACCHPRRGYVGPHLP